MAGSSRTRFRIGAAFAGVIVTLVAVAAHAALGFIVSSEVRRGAVYVEVTIRFRCNVHYLGHDPAGASDILHIRLEPTTVCTGAPPTAALTKELHRPVAAADAWLDSIEYDGESPGNEYLRVNFTEELRFDVRQTSTGDAIVVRVFPPVAEAAEPAPELSTEQRRTSRQVEQETIVPPQYVINLESTARRPATADLPAFDVPQGKSLVVAEVLIDGRTWYRVGVGYYVSAEDAARELRRLRERFPGAWIGHAAEDAGPIADTPVAAERQPAVGDGSAPAAGTAPVADDAIAELMKDARRAMKAGELSRAVQIYTKVLQQPTNDYQPEAQEYLALARERNGQIAHAKAEYQRYLDVYAEHEGAARVRQRLAALLATGPSAARPAGASDVSGRQARRKSSPWTLRTFVSQYYRRDVNQVNDQEEIVNQSSIYTDVSIDARRRGERFDLATRVTAGYRSDLLDDVERMSRANPLRVSYAYADLADAQTGLRGRIGRQTRNTGGVLGRFDGLNLTYAINDKLQFDAVGGQPVYSTSDDMSDSRMFYGLSSTFTPFSEALDIGVFYLQQDIEGLADRRAVGAELRYFGAERSLWGIVSYDTEFAELGSAFLQGSWRLPGNFTVTGLFDIRRSPFLSLGNALVGQQVAGFSDLVILFTEDELRQFALDRSPEVTTYSAGMSRPLTPKLQVNLNASLSTIAASPASGGVPATDQSEYSYYSTDLVASSLFTEGDVAIMGLRYSVSDTTDVYSVNLDTRFPIGRAWRINPRLRIDYREIRADRSTQWIYSPALRLQVRPGRRWRMELQAGKQFSYRDMETTDLDRESNFVHLGYQFFF